MKSAALLLLAPLLFTSALRASAKDAEHGRSVYTQHCASCHGDDGQGVADEYDEPLYGDRSLENLARYIDRAMPEDEPKLVSGADAEAVAAFIYDAFYSPAARDRIRPPRIAFSRLTVRQHENSLADLIAGVRPSSPIRSQGGLKAHYSSPDPKAEPPEDEAKKKDWKRPTKTIEQVDGTVAFEFGDTSPFAGELDDKEFRANWNGSLHAEDTGVYEIILSSENGVRLWLNEDQDPALIDGWVSSGVHTEHRASVFLIGGRAYPLRLEFFKYKDKSASITLKWKPPHGPEQIIPARALAPDRGRELLCVQAPFPADDGSSGYPRGIAVSKAWDEAATQAAVQTAEYVVTHLEQLAGIKDPKADDAAEKARTLCKTLIERALRRPLTAEQTRFFIQDRFEKAPDLQSAVRQSLLLALKSPAFLYPEASANATPSSSGAPDGWTVAARLALILWDSLPDEELRKAAAESKLDNPESIRKAASRMLQDPRTRAKLWAFFEHWLNLEEADDLAKDPEAYPGFDESFIAGLRTSLRLTIDDIVWSDTSDYRRLLSTHEFPMSREHAAFYGQPLKDDQPEAGEFVNVSFDPKQRAGVATHPFLLAAFSYHRSSSPIHRGVFLTRSILGRGLKPPIMAIEFMDDRFDPSLTMREKVTQLTNKAACMGCHDIINPLGFSLENFDAAGRFRTEENGQRIDATSDYQTEDGREIKLRGPRDLATHAVSDSLAQRGFITQLFQLMVKQPVNAYGADTLDRLHQKFVADQFHIRKLLVEIATLAATHPILP